MEEQKVSVEREIGTVKESMEALIIAGEVNNMP